MTATNAHQVTEDSHDPADARQQAKNRRNNSSDEGSDPLTKDGQQ